MEETLPRAYRTALSQLNSGYYKVLKGFRNFLPQPPITPNLPQDAAPWRDGARDGVNAVAGAGADRCPVGRRLLLPTPQRLQLLLPSPVGGPYWFGLIGACFSSSGSRMLQCKYFV